MKSSRLSFVWAIFLVCMGQSQVAHAQAFCALRDPVRMIFELYPTATNYQSIVARVGEQARTEIARQLDGSLHHSELGQHTLYVAVNGDKPLGLVHVRAERTKWGLAEVAWAIDLDLRVLDFRIQRARSPSRAAIESTAFRAGLRGKSAEALAEIVAPRGSGFEPREFRVANRDEDLAAAVVRSGLKAIVASQAVWGEDIRRLKSSRQHAQ
jgi:hypothetical protein